MGGRVIRRYQTWICWGGCRLSKYAESTCVYCLVIVITSGSFIDCTKRQDVFLLRQSCLRFLAMSLIYDAASCSLRVTMVCLARYLVHWWELEEFSVFGGNAHVSATKSNSIKKVAHGGCILWFCGSRNFALADPSQRGSPWQEWKGAEWSGQERLIFSSPLHSAPLRWGQWDIIARELAVEKKYWKDYAREMEKERNDLQDGQGMAFFWSVSLKSPLTRWPEKIYRPDSEGTYGKRPTVPAVADS